MRFRLVQWEVLPVRWPLRHPFVTALGQKSHSDNVVVRARLAGGAVGWGEASSSLAMPRQTGPRMAAALRRLGRSWLGTDVRDLSARVNSAWKTEGEWPAAVGAAEAALWDARAQMEGVPFFSLWGDGRRELETVLSISAVGPALMAARARRAARAGWRFLKLKLNGRETGSLNRDRLRAVHRAAPRARLLVDPNQSTTPAGMEEIFHAARRDGIAIELIEEPFPKGDWAALAAAQRKGMGPLILDESIQNPADARRAVRGGLARGPNIKLAKSGLLRSQEIMAVFARTLKSRALFMIGCMAESRIGLAAAVHFALGGGRFDYADLDSDLILSPTPVRGGYLRRGPCVVLPKRPAPGLGLSGVSGFR